MQVDGVGDRTERRISGALLENIKVRNEGLPVSKTLKEDIPARTTERASAAARYQPAAAAGPGRWRSAASVASEPLATGGHGKFPTPRSHASRA